MALHCFFDSGLRRGEHTWHYFSLWEMASEEIVIGSDIFVADRILLALQFHNTIDK